MKRRSFLRHTFHAAAVPSVLGTMGFNMAQSSSMKNLLQQASLSGKALVMIFLEGGNDGLNTVIPRDRFSELEALRGDLGLKEDQVLKLWDAEVGLHPALTDLRDLYNDGRFQIIQNVGYPNQNFSHFRSTDIWMSGSDSNQQLSTGWSGRFLNDAFPDYPEAFPNEEMQDPLSVEIGYGSSLLFQGQNATTSVTVNNVQSFYELLDNVEQDAPDSAAGEKLRFVRLIARQSQLYGERIVDVASRVNDHVPYPADNYLADQLQVVSKLIAGGSQTPLYLVRLGGFDTHDAQVLENDNTQGGHAELLTMLNDAIATFMDDLEFHGIGDKVLGMTFSEFGRTILANASNGTDHGAAAPMFFFGNAVKGGVTGRNPVLDASMTYEDNLDHQYDFRQLYASVLSQWFDVDAGQSNRVLLKDYQTLEIIGESTILDTPSNHFQDFKVFPNPVRDIATIQFTGNQEMVSVDVLDMRGTKVQTLHRGRSKPGPNTLSWNAHRLEPGRYFVLLTLGNQRKVFSVVK